MTILDRKSREIGERVKIDPFLLLSFIVTIWPVIQTYLEMFFGVEKAKGKEVIRYFMATDQWIWNRPRKRKERLNQLRMKVKEKLRFTGMDFVDVENETVNLFTKSHESELDEMIADVERRKNHLTIPGVLP